MSNAPDPMAMNLAQSASELIKAMNQTAPSALMDNHAWGFMEQFLMIMMMYPEMEDAFFTYLGDQYSPDDWAEARDALWSENSSVSRSALRTDTRSSISHIRRLQKQCKKSQNMFVLLEASEDEDEERDEDDEDDEDGTSVLSPQITQLPGTLAKERLATTIDNMVTRFEENPPKSSQGARASLTETPCCPAQSCQPHVNCNHQKSICCVYKELPLNTLPNTHQLQHVEDQAHSSLLPYIHCSLERPIVQNWIRRQCSGILASKIWLRSYSLFITTAVLFGLVDSYDLTGLLEVVLEEVKMQTPLQQEENCSVFLCKAVANLCEELNTRSQPVLWRFGPNLMLLTVNAIGPTKATEKAAHDKCHAWLLASSQSQDTMQVALNSSTPPNTPCLWESLLRVTFLPALFDEIMGR
ncbi:hypothetical protein BDR07DRAFT_1480539 [Suillus spraguei]|nr:hypothetical protein BDR07DRAFT_1480539 [Suillus spraguei]